MPEPLGSDYVIVFQDAPGAPTEALAPAPSVSPLKPWLIAGAFLAVAAGVAAAASYGGTADYDSRRRRNKGPARPTLDFVYQEGCKSCKEMDRVLEAAAPMLRQLGLTVRPIEASKIPAEWPMNATPSLQLRIGTKSVQLSKASIEKIVNAGKDAVPTLMRWAKRMAR